MAAVRAESVIVACVLAVQAILLAYSALRHSPTELEPAFLASGLSHWCFGRFELYRVNPPLPRMVAALPLLLEGCNTDWTSYYNSPGTRAEYPVGSAFIEANGRRSVSLVYHARWACIPLNLLGSYFAYRWAKELYSACAGLVALALYAFDPNLLAHGELVTPDGACCSFGVLSGYALWRWLKTPSWARATWAGLAMGLAQLTKLSWLILFGLWPALWLAWRWMSPSVTSCQKMITPERSSSVDQSLVQPPAIQLACLLLIGIGVINLGYGFDGTGTPLKAFQFISKAFTGHSEAGILGNRFQQSWVGGLPVPVPAQYLLGIDTQQKDLEHFDAKSYLRGEIKQGGWWYYYIYGLLVKVPSGTLILFALVVISRSVASLRLVPLRDELVLLVPAVSLLAVVSSHTQFNLHLRYVFPCLSFALIFVSQGTRFLTNWNLFDSVLTYSCLAASLFSLASVYPHHLAHFNDFVGGSKNGWKHLLGSSFDWGQDLLLLQEYAVSHGSSVGGVRGLDDRQAVWRSIFGDVVLQGGSRMFFVSPNAIVNGSSYDGSNVPVGFVAQRVE